MNLLHNEFLIDLGCCLGVLFRVMGNESAFLGSMIVFYVEIFIDVSMCPFALVGGSSGLIRFSKRRLFISGISCLWYRQCMHYRNLD